MRWLPLFLTLLIAKITLAVLANYPDYFPPNFDADFLLGREAYFWNGYHIAFFAHILIGPWTLVIGTLLLSQQFLRSFPKWHRRLGRLQAVCVLGVIVPSGVVMARYAANGPVAGLGFTVLSLLTGLFLCLGWRAAVQRRFLTHREWMTRCYLMLFSTVLVRLNAGLGTVLLINAEWFYAHTAWTSWLVPWMIYEALRRRRRASFIKSRQPAAIMAGVSSTGAA